MPYGYRSKRINATVTDGVTEGGSVDFTVSSTAGTFGGLTVVVSYSTATGTAGSSDFTRVSGSRSIAVGGEATVTVETEQDTRAEAAETFSLTLTGVRMTGVRMPGGGAVLGDDRATVTITDNDNLTATVTSLQTSVLEGADARFEVALTANNESASGSTPVVVLYTVIPNIPNGATSADYTEPSGKMTIPAGQSTGTIVISTTADNVLELTEETIVVQLDSATTTATIAPTVMGPSQPTRIRDRDGTVVVSIADAAPVDEGQAAVFTVSLSGKVSQDVVVTPTTPAADNDNAGDFSAPQPAMLIIEAGETTGTVTVQTTDDASDPRAEARAEADETITLSLALPTPPPGVVLGKNTATGTIRDNDPLRVNISGPSAVFSDATNAQFMVNLTGGMGSGTITVDYTYTVGSTSGSDSVEIANNADSATITIMNTTIMNPDNAFVAGHTLVVTLTDADSGGNGTVTVGTSRASARIADYVISAAPVEAAEGGNLVFTVIDVGTAPMDTVVVVTASTSPGTARANSDYTTHSDTFNFTGNRSITVSTLLDNLNEGPETVTLRLRASPASVLVGTPTVTGTITDDDGITATVIRGQTTVTEGDPATFIVSLSGGTSTAECGHRLHSRRQRQLVGGRRLYTAPSRHAQYSRSEQRPARSPSRPWTTARSTAAKS